MVEKLDYLNRKTDAHSLSFNLCPNMDAFVDFSSALKV